MNLTLLTRSLVIAFAVGSFAFALPARAAVDEDAAKHLFKENECGKCHSPEKAKKGPSLKKTAKKYKEKGMAAAEAEKDVIKHMTTPKKVKLDDGTEEEHKLIETKDPKALSNLAQWILSH